MVAAVLIAFALLFMPYSTHASEIYQWTDDSGDTHYADRVPQKYKSVARKIAPGAGVSVVGSGGSGTNNAHSAPLISGYRSPVGADAESQSGNAASSGASGTSGTQDSAVTCESLRRQYWASQACFNQFRNANGSVKAEAFEQCREVPSPVDQCGPLITEP